VAGGLRLELARICAIFSTAQSCRGCHRDSLVVLVVIWDRFTPEFSGSSRRAFVPRVFFSGNAGFNPDVYGYFFLDIDYSGP
jgi:hypothetical protein